MKCPKCNEDLVWDNDFSYEDYGCEGEGIVSVYHCQKCTIEMVEIYESLNPEE